MNLFNYVKEDQFGEREVRVSKIFGHIVMGIVFLIILFGSWSLIDAGERGVVLKVGKVDRVMQPGFNLKIPIIERVIKMEVRTQKIEREASSASNDLQIVTTNVALNFNLDPAGVGVLYEEVGVGYRPRIIDPAIQDSVKAATARFNAEALITKRPQVKQAIEQDLEQRLLENNILVTDVSIVNFKFSEEFDTAIEAKVTAEQRALEAENKLRQVEFEAQQRIEQARGEAEAIRIQAQAITQQGGKDYVNLQWIEAWKTGGADVPTTIIGEGGNSFLYNIGR